MHQPRRSRLRSTPAASVLALAVAAIVAACTAPTGGGATTAPTAGAPAGGTGPMVEVRQDPTHGSVLAVDGRSVYLFTQDPMDGGTACLEGCATAWPPVTVADGSEPVAGSGVIGALSTIERPDGGRQVAIGGHPLYFFANDAAPGDVAGHGLNGVWFLVTPDGRVVGGAAGASPTPKGSPEPCSGRYCY
jgi:predicted lipoprotein with Yx(FWY)xxD motif